jgi:flagellar basal body-associated protein FliL
MKKLFYLIASISVLIVALSITYYFVSFLPSKKIARQELERQKISIQEEESKDARSTAISECSSETPRLTAEKLSEFRASMLEEGFSLEKINAFLDIKLMDYENELKNCLQLKGFQF